MLLLNKLLSYILIELLLQLVWFAVPLAAQNHIVDDRTANILAEPDPFHAIGHAHAIVVPNSL